MIYIYTCTCTPDFQTHRFDRLPLFLPVARSSILRLRSVLAFCAQLGRWARATSESGCGDTLSLINIVSGGLEDQWFIFFHIKRAFHHPNCRTQIFRGVFQPPTRRPQVCWVQLDFGSLSNQNNPQLPWCA